MGRRERRVKIEKGWLERLSRLVAAEFTPEID